MSQEQNRQRYFQHLRQRYFQHLRQYLARWFQQFSTVGLLLATLFFAFSLTPSLVPRTTLFQGLVSGLSLSLGYMLGWTARQVWSYLELPEPGARTHRTVLAMAAAISVSVAVVFLWRASGWQNAVRALMGMEPVDTVRPFTVALIALLVFFAALLLGRVFRQTCRLFAQLFKRYLPRRIAYVIGLLFAAALFWLITEGLILSALLRATDSSFQELDALVPEELSQPRDPMKTGSVASLISWEDLGRQGRKFVTMAPAAVEIGEFAGEHARAPIRVYVGLNAADSAEERAELALQELVRVGAFERSVLLLITPTGTGWIDPSAINTVEYLHRGDIASVAAQYSYLPSPLALLTEGAYGAEMAQALFEKVYRYWTKLPEGRRPRLYVHGMSLGALNSELSFHLHDILADPFHGALWVGPPFRSKVWSDVTANRHPASPMWLPRFRNGRVVRFMNQYEGLQRPDTEWGPLRMAYLQYASDPTTFFSVRSAVRKPDWMRAPRAPDVSDELRWYPLVTMLQLVADLLAGGDSVPPGYGHHFAARDYVDAWVALTEPDGWTESEIQRLKALLDARQRNR